MFGGLLITTIIALSIRLGFVFNFYFPYVLRLKKVNSSAELSKTKSTEGVSVVISAKNEEKNLRENLPYILKQDFKKFEVIVVNDRSEDETEAVVNELSKEYDNLKLASLHNNLRDYKGKKLALTIGIKKAMYDIILLTDADCRPVSTKWIQSMHDEFRENTKIVIGYSPYEKQNGLLGQISGFESFYTALQYLSFAFKKKPYMAVGRNLAYRKSFFLDNKGFSGQLNIPSGDDDLFVNKNATGTNTAIAMSQDSHVVSTPKASWESWLRQKKRHLSAGRYYKSNTRALLGFNWLTGFIFYASVILSLFLFTGDHVYLPLYFLGFNFMVLLPVYYIGMKQKKVFHLWWPGVISDVLYHLIYYPVAGLFALVRGRKSSGW